jgi:hypothetical protein
MATKVNKTDRKIGTKEKLEKMLDLINTGMSYSDVAKELGTTKNAVSGYVFRIKNRGWVTKPKTENTHKPRVIKIRNKVSISMPPTTDGLTIFELNSNTCRYMIGHHKYCGHMHFKRSYCEYHFKECHDFSRGKKK